MKRRYWLLSAGALVVLTAGAVVFWLNRAPEPRTLVFVQDWNQGAELQALNQVLSRFHSLYPALTVSLRDRQTGLSAETDLVASPGFSSEQRLLLSSPPVAWSGGLWVLAARKEILDTTAQSLPTEVAALREGRATPAMFRKLAGAIAGSGKTPFTLGNSHRWPFLVWLQHWGAATVGPSAVDPFPTAFEALQPAYEELMEWKTKGWFAPAVWKMGWAQGLQPLDDGKAAFALVSEGNLGAIQPKNLNHVEFLPFPRAEGVAPWNVGSALYLGIPAGAAHPQDAELLLRFLTSPGITQELTGLTGRPFFSWSPGQAAPQVIPSWAEAAMTAPYNALSARFDPK